MSRDEIALLLIAVALIAFALAGAWMAFGCALH